MKRLLLILLIISASCEEVVVIDLPISQNLVVVEGWLTDIEEQQSIRLSRTNGFLNEVPIVPIEDANVVVQTRTGTTFTFLHDEDGFYRSNGVLKGNEGTEYRVRIQLNDGVEIRSEWERMPTMVPINSLSVESFRENDPDNPNQRITVYYPKINATDPEGIKNFYRWVFFKDRQIDPDFASITIQDDRFFNGNLIPNNFQEFDYEEGDEIIVQFQSITKEAFEFLRLLRSQTTTLGTSSGTTPAVVNGNLSYSSEEESSIVLGYFGTIAISSDTTTAE